MSKSMKVGGGGRFEKLEKKIEKEKGYSKESAQRVAAAIGREKYGDKKMNSMAQKGRARGK
jgi:aspartokinase-like uncharacterized kinase